MNLDGVTFINTPNELPANPDELADNAYISTAVFAHLANINLDSFRSMRTRHDKRRGTGDQRAGDFPAADERIGNSPVWTLGTFRAWKASRPGKGAGGGRRVGFRPPPTRIKLPHPCPHCGHEITGKDVQAQERATTGK